MDPEGNGGPSASLSKLDFPPLEVTEFIPLFHTSPHFDGVFLHQKYVVEGLSAAQIATEIFSSRSTILKALKENKIELREAHQHHGNPAETRYGKRKWGSRQIDHAAEQKVIEAVIEMKKASMGLRQIARTLTSMGIQTKCQGKRWHPEMVRRIIQLANSRSKEIDTKICLISKPRPRECIKS